jgi:hypothetical protein
MLVSEDAVSPSCSTSGFHVGHGPDDQGLFIGELIGAQAVVGLAGVEEGTTMETVSIKL